MLVGYNTNISYKGVVYHVQTEDSGTRNPHIITLLYNGGTILCRKKTDYAELAEDPDYKDKVRELMKEQHKAMIKELIAGKHTMQVSVSPAEDTTAEEPAVASLPVTMAKPAMESEPIAEPEPVLAPERTSTEPEPQEGIKPEEPEANKKQISKSLDDILLDYLMKEDT